MKSLRGWLVLERLEARELLSGAAMTTEGLREAYGQIPLNFEANQGQTDAQVQFLPAATAMPSS